MKNVIVIILLFTIPISAYCQIVNPVKWSYAAKRANKTKAIILIKATIGKGWHIYSVNQKDGGPIKTSFALSKSSDYNLIGRITEPKPSIRYEKSFQMNVSYFEKSVIFQQKIRLKSKQTDIKGSLNFMACNDQKCLPPEDVNFKLPIK